MNKKLVVALIGNPNVGKSTVFNQLTGLHQHTGNWPGKTVASAWGKAITNENITVVDLPGTYSLLTHSAEEEVSRDFIMLDNPDVVVVVCDATSIERNMNLVLQTMEIAKHIVVCVNLMDEAAKKGIHLDLIKLQDRLNVPVVGCSARSNQGLEKLINVIETESTETEYRGNKTEYSPLVKSVIENSGINVNHVHEEKIEDEIIHNIIDHAHEICTGIITYKKEDYNKKDRKIDRILTNKIIGIPIMIILLAIIFWITLIGANYPSELLSQLFFYLEEHLLNLFSFIHIPAWITDMLVLGVYRVLTWVIAVMLPPMAIFFPLFTLLEDIGYLPRIAFNLDNQFKKCNACGKQALTMCMGFGCNAVGVMGARIIDSPRERLIAIITNNFVPCNGRFPTLIAVISMFFTYNFFGAQVMFLTLIIIIGILVTFMISKILSMTILKGEPSSFILELPPYRKPQVGKVIIRSILDRTLFVLSRAVLIALPAGLVIWIFSNIMIGELSIFSHCANFLHPFAHMIGLDGTILLAFILGFPANEIVLPIIIMAYMSTGNLLKLHNLVELKSLLIDNGWTWITAVSVMLFSLMHWPCSTTLLTIKKETESWKWSFVSFIIPATIGILICFLFTTIARLFI